MCNVCTMYSVEYPPQNEKARLLNPARAHEDCARRGGRGARSRARGPAPVASTRTVSPYIKPFIWLLRFNGAHLRSAGDARTGASALTVPHITTCALDWKRTLTRYLEQHSPTPSDRSRSSIPYWLNLSSIAEPLYTEPGPRYTRTTGFNRVSISVRTNPNCHSRFRGHALVYYAGVLAFCTPTHLVPPSIMRCTTSM